jgi:diaminohydroxyphosphoribosylaminopyrimidine deaminase/5-amino-6-(5-phosphoribosylamino)uracil reductase
MAADQGASRLMISNAYTNRLVHQWRSEEAGILVGTNTALLDDPELTNRLWDGPSPVRLVLDMDLRLPDSLKLFNREQKTVVFNSVKSGEQENLIYYRLEKNKSLISQLMSALYNLGIQSVLVEGGARLIQSFMDEGAWDEARIITNKELYAGTGLAAPVLQTGQGTGKQELLTDEIRILKNSGPFKTNEI